MALDERPQNERPLSPDEAAAIAARYRVAVPDGVAVRHCALGETSRSGYVWDGAKNMLMVAGPQPADKAFRFGGGRAPKGVDSCGHHWVSQAACAMSLGMTPTAVSNAIRKGRLDATVLRILGPAVAGGQSHAA